MLKLFLMAGVSALAVSGAAAGATMTFNYSGSLVDWTAPKTGEYVIDVFGAQGGDNSGAGGPSGGLGVGLRGEFNLLGGEIVEIAVGGEGVGNSTGGGGGGSFVATSGGAPLIVAGGGGGISYLASGSGDNAKAATGNGQGGSAHGAGGGGGFYSSGADYHAFLPEGELENAYGGGAFPALPGGSGFYGAGGFGGGGGGGYNVGGGGGGFGGGNAGDGGLSFNAGADQSTLGYQSGNGLVTITAVPEPATWNLMLSGLGFLGYVLRRRVLRLIRSKTVFSQSDAAIDEVAYL